MYDGYVGQTNYDAQYMMYFWYVMDTWAW